MSSNPYLSSDRLGVNFQGSPSSTTSRSGTALPPPPASLEQATSDGATAPMTMKGVMTASGLLFVVLAIGFTLGWRSVEVQADVVTQYPSWITATVAAGFGLAIAAYFMPKFIKFIGPLYALVEGLLLGAVSHVYDVAYDGIALQAVMATLAVFAAMLVLYATGTIRVTEGFRRVIVTATLGVMLMYVVQFVVNLLGFGGGIPYLHDSGPVGIAISLFLVGLAAFNYLVDFDFVSRAIAAGAPRDTEWVAAFGLLATTVWLYFEVLRLLAKLRD